MYTCNYQLVGRTSTNLLPTALHGISYGWPTVGYAIYGFTYNCTLAGYKNVKYNHFAKQIIN